MTDTPATKREALAAVDKISHQVERAKQRLLDLQGARDWAVYQAQGLGATYPELSAASGLSQARVKQVLTDTRNRQPEPNQE